MLNHSLLLFNGAGRIRNTIAPPTAFSGGVGFAAGLLCIEAGAGLPTHFHNGMGFLADGRLAAVVGSVNGHAQGGLAMNAGRLTVTTSGVIDHYNSGLPCSATGSLCIE